MIDESPGAAPNRARTHNPSTARGTDVAHWPVSELIFTPYAIGITADAPGALPVDDHPPVKRRIRESTVENPYLGCALSELALACDERANELQARSWNSEAERNALREATAELLSAVAQQLSGVLASTPGKESDGSPSEELGISALREIIATHVTHTPLSGGARHAWVQAFNPGDDGQPPPRD